LFIKKTRNENQWMNRIETHTRWTNRPLPHTNHIPMKRRMNAWI
jgi:hypothetical protein